MSDAKAILRPVSAADEPEFLELARASTDLHRPWIFAPTGPGEFATYLKRFDGVSAFGFVVCDRESGLITGMINISQVVRNSYQRGVLGYGVFAPFARQGYLAEGLWLAVEHAFVELGLHRLEADIQPENTASSGLVRRLGFRLEGFSAGLINLDGVWQDYERWAITSDMINELSV